MERLVTLRQADRHDAEAIAALTRAAYGRWVAVIGREPAPMTVDYAQRVTRHRFDLLHEDHLLTGLIETTPVCDHLLIENVAVRPEAQGRGYGRRLLGLAETLASADGLTGVRLYTNQKFVTNIRLYAALGYRITSQEPMNGGVAVHMAKALPGTACV